MKKKNVQLLLFILSIVCLLILVAIQIRWVLRSAKVQEAQFSHTITLAMNRIVDNLSANQVICSEMKNCLQAGRNSSCFLLMHNKVEWADLNSIIHDELNYYDINLDYEFDIVKKDSVTDHVRQNSTYINDNLEKILNQSGYELRLRFPGKNEFIKAQAGYIFFSSIALLLLVSVSFILIYRFYRQEKRLSGNIISFVNNMTHEFKTPLTNIALANSMISKHTIITGDEKLSSYTGIIKNEHQRLREKVDVLLKASVAEDDYTDLYEDIDTLVEIQKIVEAFSVQVNRRQGAIMVETNGSDFTISTKIDLFREIIRNLIDNAIKYNLGRPLIKIELEKKDSLKIRISDNGIGIRKEELSMIFNKYYRVPTGNVHDNEGFGLGLYFVKKAVADLKGYVKVSSHPGAGTTFFIELPLNKNA
ncbi:MAG TPA: HAMP domain-containing sensor histidine kinase [Bacteroidales bacterium]|nr:HAMP domain-containing sensor histidine kinase [Bacteroidales bacterium]